MDRLARHGRSGLRPPAPGRPARRSFLERSRRALALALLAAAAALPAGAAEPPAAVVLMYHRFGEDDLPSTNIRLDQFERHLELLAAGPYTVLPLDEVVRALATGAPLPERSVAITIDDVARSIATEAAPRLRAAGLPFTVFVDTDAVGRGPRSLGWDEVRALHAAGATIGAHSAAHGHMAFMDRDAIARDLARMKAAFVRELGFAPTLFAYPYGEFSERLAAMVRDAGHLAAFGQHSGVAVAGGDLFALPRFALNERYGEAGRFANVVEALPLPVADLAPRAMAIAAGAPNPPPIGFTVGAAAGPLQGLTCFASNGAGIALDRKPARRVELRLDRPFPPGRSRINCTLPAGDGRFRWLGLPFLVPGGSD